MSNLRDMLAEHGFESNDDYDYQLRCLLESPTAGIRTLDIEGDGERRKTAFAIALARALAIPHILYHDFTDARPPLPEVILPPGRDELGRTAAPIEPLDEVVIEACAQSEGDPTVLILDQLQAADFRDHIRLQRLAGHCVWPARDQSYHANRHHLLLFLIAEAPIYHGLQKESFRVWIGRLSEHQGVYDPSAFGFGPEAEPLFAALADLFRQLGCAPTRTEFGRILHDLQLHTRTREQLQLTLYGRVEGVDRLALRAPALSSELTRVLAAAQTLLLAEHIELAGDHTAP